ncbi:MAG: presenilin family intramembrane aspartyl protease [archaeon]
MKHNLKITIFLVILFFTAQVVGLFLLKQSIASIVTTDSGEIVVNYSEPITGRPELKNEESFTYIFVMILIGTGLLFLLMKYRLFKVWKAWFFLAVWGSLTIATSVIIGDTYAIILSLALAYFKVFRPNPIIHNVTEVFIYAGIAIMISPIFTVFWASMLLIAISIYDAIAVWKSKHMIVLAQAQSENKMFAGLMLNYEKDSAAKYTPIKTNEKIKSNKRISAETPIQKREVNTAILGGGDIAFPLLFSGSVMTLLIESGLSSSHAFFQTLIVSAAVTGALFLLFLKSEKGKYYPAMPFLTIGCFIGYGIILLI